MCTLGSKLHGHRRGGRVLQRLAIDATYCHSPQYRSAVWHCLPACIVTCRQRVVKTVAALSRRQARGGCSSPPKPSKDELPLLQAIARASATRRPSSHRSTQACSVPALLIYHHLVSSRGMCSHRQPRRRARRARPQDACCTAYKQPEPSYRAPDAERKAECVAPADPPASSHQRTCRHLSS